MMSDGAGELGIGRVRLLCDMCLAFAQVLIEVF